MADPAGWTVTFEGIGPFTIGTSLSAPELPPLGSDADPIACRSFTDPAINSILVVPKTDAEIIDALYVSGAAASGKPATAEGIGIGSTEQEAVAAYPDAVLTPLESGLGSFYVITDGAGRYIHFGVTDGIVGSITVIDSPDDPIEFCG